MIPLIQEKNSFCTLNPFKLRVGNKKIKVYEFVNSLNVEIHAEMKWNKYDA